MENSLGKYGKELNLEATELRLGLPGSDEPEKRSAVRSNKRSSPEPSVEESRCNSNGSSDSTTTSDHDEDSVQPAK